MRGIEIILAERRENFSRAASHILDAAWRFDQAPETLFQTIALAFRGMGVDNSIMSEVTKYMELLQDPDIMALIHEKLADLKNKERYGNGE